MGRVIKILQATDVHETDVENLPRYHKLNELMGEADLAYYGGDFFEVEHHLWQEMVHGVLEDLVQRHSEETVRDWMFYGQVTHGGGVQELKSLLGSQELSEENRDQLEAVIGEYEQNRDRIEGNAKKIETDDEFRRQNEQLLGNYAGKIREIYGRLADVMAEAPAPILVVRGNHDLDMIDEALDDLVQDGKVYRPDLADGAVSVPGIDLTFAGAMNWYEALRVVPGELYQTAEFDLFMTNKPESQQMWAKQALAFIQQYGTEDDVLQYVESVKRGDPWGVPDRVKEKLPVAQRLKGTKADVLLTHKGMGMFATSGDVDQGSGIGLDYVVKEMQPAIHLCGHVHGEGLVSEENGVQGVRSSDQKVYMLHVDEETKEVVQVDVYTWDDRELVSHADYEASQVGAYRKAA